MISRHDGEVSFSDGLVIRPHMPLWHLPSASRDLAGGSLMGWGMFTLGTHPSQYGDFAVEVACATVDQRPVFLVVLVSMNPFFRMPVEKDRERRVFHEGVLARELSGQREFSWGEAFCKYNQEDRRDCLNVVYTAGPKVPSFPGSAAEFLTAEASHPEP